MKRSSVFKMAYSALFAALVFAGTAFIKVPLPFGYFHFGDSFILLAGYFLGSLGAAPAAIGSVLADVLSGYAVYGPATLTVKAIMPLAVFFVCRKAQKNTQKSHVRFVLGACIAETVMVFGYFLFDWLLYGISGALASLLGNLTQGVSAVLIAAFIKVLLDKTDLSARLFGNFK